MVNNQKSPEVIKAAVNDIEMAALLNATGLKPGKTSPLAQISGKAAPDALRNLRAAGMTDAANQPTADCREALTILANPASEIDLIWGNPNGISLSKTYAAGGQDRLVSFTSMNGVNNISYFLSSQDIIDLMIERLAFSEIKDAAALNIEASPAVMPVFFAALDIYREAQLRAALEHRQETGAIISLEEVNRVIQESKLEIDFNWYSPAVYNAMPLDTTIDEAMAEEGYRILKSEGIAGEGGELNDSFTALAYRAFPLTGFFGIKVLKADAGAPEKTQLALFRGLSTLLLAQLAEENGRPVIQISSISTSQLPELLFNLGTRPFEVNAPEPPAVPANTVDCNKCGTQNSVTAKFCSKCGAVLAAAPAGPKFCPKCGDPVTAGEKFCDKCGLKLV